MLSWFDSHCHLHLSDDHPAEVIRRARAVGVSDVVTVGIDVASSKRAVEIASEHSVWASVGIHPNSAGDWTDDAAAAIESLVRDERVVAVGESGLDFYRDAAARELQHDAFRAHIALAKDHDKALIVHTRDSVDQALDVLEEQRPPERVVFHCWSGDHDSLKRALALGAWVSFAGNVSFPSAAALRDASVRVPEARLLIETDSPFLSPVPFRGKPNEPQRVVEVGRAVAAARGTTVDEIAAITRSSAHKLFDTKAEP